MARVALVVTCVRLFRPHNLLLGIAPDSIRFPRKNPDCDARDHRETGSATQNGGLGRITFLIRITRLRFVGFWMKGKIACLARRFSNSKSTRSRAGRADEKSIHPGHPGQSGHAALSGCRNSVSFVKVSFMPHAQRPAGQKSLEQVVASVGLYPMAAYEFVQHGLAYTVRKIHGEEAARPRPQPVPCRHVTGQDLCLGLREFALLKWGFLARTVLARWNIRRTIDFGRIVFALVESGWMAKTDQDSIEDFRDVFDFSSAFETDYRIEMKA
jgi:uncharacterized repeat protein (TIGR04138 family)